MNPEIDLRVGSLSKIETWITSPTQSDDGWTEIKSFLFLRLTTSDGVEGWGEAFTLPCREIAIEKIIRNLVNAVAKDKDITPHLFRDKAAKISDKHRGIDFSAATSAIEMALWDIGGKISKKPLANLLSENPKPSIPVYATNWSNKETGTEAIGKRAVKLIEQNFGGVKIYPLQNRSPEEGAKFVSYVRNLIGSETPLMLDLASPDNAKLAYELAPLVAPFNPYWYEEPVDGENTRTLADIRSKTGLRIVTGEKQCGLPHFEETLSANAADILNPDIAAVGGLLDMTQISEWSLKKNVKVSPHCWNSMSIAAAAMLHFCTSIKNAEKAEIFPEYLSHVMKFCDPGFKIDRGHAVIGEEPGLGVSMDTSLLKSLCSDYNEEKLRK
ncbi:uncharacterized protein METZ01_LOCUS88535 [marine metagenome]|uniref:Mandelate racemase/muconate lactonizing enzyme C-terminal domain-containing protein n=1 Tax=marine metagenome TaxID=408172 RepID=A0A381V6Q0_9ZZZZ|tara:strand:- start:424 stop:1575 length:1152 start_codon:yes stop_codon:yes gene_type:complete